MKGQFMVLAKDKKEWNSFYSYILENFNLKDGVYLNQDNHFLFVVDFDKNNLWICNSITCCACASQANRIISVDDFKKIVERR